MLFLMLERLIEAVVLLLLIIAYVARLCFHRVITFTTCWVGNEVSSSFFAKVLKAFVVAFFYVSLCSLSAFLALFIAIAKVSLKMN